jgi:hypothetical protein
MACLLNTGRKLACKDAVGGIRRVFLADYGTLGTATISNTGYVTAFTGSYALLQYDVKSASGLEQTINSSDDNGTTFFEQVLTLVLTKLDPLTQVELKNVIAGRPHVFIEDNNGNYLAVGMTRGTTTTGSITSGIALGDLNGYTLTITGQEPLMAQFVTASLVTNNILEDDGTDIPTQITPI